MNKTDEQLREIGKKATDYTRIGFIFGVDIAEIKLEKWMQGYRYKENEKPELKPLSELTEEHAVEICKIATDGLMRQEFYAISVVKDEDNCLRCKAGSHSVRIYPNGQVDCVLGGDRMFTYNQAQIIKFYIDNGYDIFNQNGM